MQMLAVACMLADVPLIVSMHTDVAQIANVDQEFSAVFSGTLGRIHARLAVWFTLFGYRLWAFAGARFFCVSKQARSILQDARVLPGRVAPVTWGPMVDGEVFRMEQPEGAVAELRKDLTFGIEDAFLMVYVGRVTPEKDIMFLVEALKRAPKNVVLALIGGGSLCPRLVKLHGRAQRLHCTGEMLPRDRVALIMRAADCCVSASSMETVGFTAMEALSCGTPMLAVNAQGFAEHLSDGVNAQLWTPNDTASFDQKLATLMGTPREANWTREALRASIQSASIERCTDRALKAYLHAQRPNWRPWRLALSYIMFLVNRLLVFLIR